MKLPEEPESTRAEAVLAFHMALAQDNARPERREIKNATLERSVGNFWAD